MSRNNYAALEAGWVPGDLGAFTHVGNKKIKLYDSGGGGGGGGGSSQPTHTTSTQTGTQTTYQTTIPEYARPYMERLLGKSEAASEAPYQTYGGERLAPATPQQQAARAEVAGLQTPGQFGFGTGLTGAGGLGSLGAGQQYMGLATSPAAQQAFMSPYMQNVVDIQKQEAVRDAQMGQLGQNLAAARQGTYGGARQLLAQTERERNLGQQLAQIQATGSQKAFEAAQQAQQFGVQTGLQGYGQAVQAGQALGQMGAQQQATDIARLQAQEAYGALGQRDRQAALDLAYQDFLAQQRYPYSQLGFMSDILRGSGNLATTGGTAVYAPPPSTGSQLLGLAGTLGGAYLAGGGKFFREGGEVGGLGAVKNFAGGGAVKSMFDVNKLTAEQIEDTREDKSRPDVPDLLLLAELDSKIAEFKRLEAAKAQPPQLPVVDKIRQEAMQVAGLPSIPVDEDYYMSEEAALASGGIVAFAGGGMSMDPGMPYGLGYSNNMGYEGGGIVAFQDGGESMFGMTPMGEPSGIGLPQMIDTDPERLRGASKLQLYPLMTPDQQAEYAATGQIPASFLQSEAAKKFSAEKRAQLVAPKKKEAESEKPAPKKTAPKAEVSEKTAKKIEKAEDEYEKYLRSNMMSAEMGEADRQQAIGFALMKAGARAMAGKSQYAMQNIGEAVESGADEYIRYINQAKKDKKEAQKTLGEYRLAKEKLGIEREKIAATERNTAALQGVRQSAQNREAIEAARKAYDAEMQMVPLSKRPPFEVWVQRSGYASMLGLSGGSSTPVEGRTAKASDFYNKG